MRLRTLRILAATLVLHASLMLMSNENGPSTAASGSPLNNGINCTVCHFGTANSGSGNVQIAGIDVYKPGETYNMTIKVSDESSTKFGFQAIALDKNNKPIGTVTPATGTEIFANGGNKFVQHSSPNSEGKFAFSWTAPSSNVGDITFYVAGNATNNNGTTSGDHVYTTNYKVTGNATSVAQLAEATFSIYPNPSKGDVYVQVVQEELNTLEVIDINGKQVFFCKSIKKGNILIDGLETGFYLVKAENDNGQIVKKLIVK